MSAPPEAVRGQPRRFAGLGVRAKLFLTIVVVVGVATALSELVAEDALEGLLLRRIEAELHATAAGAAVALDHLDGGAAQDAAALDGLADALGAATGVRVTLIDAAGRVRGDSEVALADLAGVEQHNTRAEVISARKDGQGTARRRSATLATDMLYVAVRAPVGNVVYVARAATPLVEVAQSVRALRVALAVAGGVALGVALALGALASQVMSGRLRALVRRTQRVRGAAVVFEEDEDEIGKLAVTVGTLESALDAQVRMLERERDRFEAVLRAMGEGVVALDREGRVLFFNPAARQLLALDDAAVGQRLAVLFPTLSPLVQRAEPADTEPVRSVELDVHTASARALLRVSRQDAAFGAVVVVHDVTDIRRLERLRRDFVANVSHELRTPVSIILANGEMLLSGALEDKERAVKFVEAVHRNAERLKDLINDLLDIARMEAGEQTFARVPVDLHAVASHVVELLAPRAEDKRQTVSVHVDVDLRVAGDAKAIDQVLTNLVENAIKYTPEEGHIVVRAARAAASTVRISVEDDGPGVEEKHRARLFERFYRVDKGRSRDQGGTGLGLAIVKHLVEGMGGSVGVEVRAPRGMVFWFELSGA